MCNILFLWKLDEETFLPLVWDFLLSPNFFEETVQSFNGHHTTCIDGFWGNTVQPRSHGLLQSNMAAIWARDPGTGCKCSNYLGVFCHLTLRFLMNSNCRLTQMKILMALAGYRVAWHFRGSFISWIAEFCVSSEQIFANSYFKTSTLGTNFRGFRTIFSPVSRTKLVFSNKGCDIVLLYLI